MVIFTESSAVCALEIKTVPVKVKKMNKRPVVFALANPIPEIMPNEAKSVHVYIYASGRSDFPNQINNALVFPGFFRGALDNHVVHITTRMKIRAAENIAKL